MIEKTIIKALKETGITAGQKELINSAKYLNAIWEANSYLNLTAARSIEELVNKHFIDSIYLIKHYPLGEGQLLDLGTGAGFPGIPLKLFNPGLTLYLLDSVRRKLNFLKYTVDGLELKQTFYLHGRAETYGRDDQYRETISSVCSRAVAAMPLLLEIGLPLVKVGGIMIIYKGPKGEAELSQSAGLIDMFGGALEKQISYKLPGGEKRVIYIIRKISPMPPQYPRKKLKNLH